MQTFSSLFPCNRRRLWHRRYNQAAFLADAVSRLAGVPTNPLVLRRTRSTVNQVGLTRDQRSPQRGRRIHRFRCSG